MAFLLSFQPGVRNLDVMAGTQAAFLDYTETGHTIGRLGGTRNPVNFMKAPHQPWNNSSIFLHAKE